MNTKDKIMADMLAERVNMLEAQGRSEETHPLREAHRELVNPSPNYVSSYDAKFIRDMAHDILIDTNINAPL